MLIAVGRDGRAQEAGWWNAPAGVPVTRRGATSLLPEDDVRGEIRSRGTALLTLPA